MTVKGRIADAELAKCFLVSCVSEKRNAPAKAKDLYISALFTKARALVEKAGGTDRLNPPPKAMGWTPPHLIGI